MESDATGDGSRGIVVNAFPPVLVVRVFRLTEAKSVTQEARLFLDIPRCNAYVHVDTYTQREREIERDNE